MITTTTTRIMLTAANRIFTQALKYVLQNKVVKQPGVLFECKKIWVKKSDRHIHKTSDLVTCWSDLHYHRCLFRPRWLPGGHRSSWRPAWGPPASSDWQPPSFQCPFPANTGQCEQAQASQRCLNNKTKIKSPICTSSCFLRLASVSFLASSPISSLMSRICLWSRLFCSFSRFSLLLRWSRSSVSFSRFSLMRATKLCMAMGLKVLPCHQGRSVSQY